MTDFERDNQDGLRNLRQNVDARENQRRLDAYQEKWRNLRYVVTEISEIDQNLSTGEIVDLLFTFVDAFFDAQDNRPRSLQSGDKDPNSLFNVVEQELQALVAEGNLEEEMRVFFLSYFTSQRILHITPTPTGALAVLMDSAVETMRDSADQLNWTTLDEEFVTIEERARTALEASGENNIEVPIEDPAIRLDDSLQQIRLRTMFDDPTVVDIFDDVTFDRMSPVLAATATQLDQSGIRTAALLPPNVVKELKTYQARIIESLRADITPEAREELVLLRIFITELFDRDRLQRAEGFIEEDNRMGNPFVMSRFFRPQHEYLEKNGRDAVKDFFELIGNDDIDRLEKIALQISYGYGMKKPPGLLDKTAQDRFENFVQIVGTLAESEKVNLSKADLEFIKSVRSRIEKTLEGYWGILSTLGDDIYDDETWNFFSTLDRVGTEYVAWTDTIFEVTGNTAEMRRRVPGADETEPAESERAPDLNHAREKWLEFFNRIAGGDDGLERMATWGDTIMSSFYPSTNPTESYKSRLESMRFSAWKDALSEHAVGANRVEYLNLLKKVDNKRLIVDNLITYGQSRILSASWYDRAQRDRFGIESVALYPFPPTVMDFFRGVEAEEENRYKFSAQFEMVRKRIQTVTSDPNSPFYIKKFAEDGSTRDRLKADLTTWIKEQSPDIDPKDADEVVDVAYNTSCLGDWGPRGFELEHAGGGSPAPAYSEHVKMYAQFAPIIAILYSCYKDERFAVTAMDTYRPQWLFKKIIELFGTGLDLATAKEIDSAGDFERRIRTISNSYDLSALAYEVMKKFPLRIFDKNPFGYEIEQNPQDENRMMYPYPLLYDFWFTEPYASERRRRNLSNKDWAVGANAFIDFNAKVNEPVPTEGKNAHSYIDACGEHLIAIRNLFSPLKTNPLVDWNYILVKMVSAFDKMFIGLHDVCGKNAIEYPKAVMHLQHLIGGHLGHKGMFETWVEDGYAKQFSRIGDNDLIDQRDVQEHEGDNTYNVIDEVEEIRFLPADQRAHYHPHHASRNFREILVHRWMNDTNSVRDNIRGANRRKLPEYIHRQSSWWFRAAKRTLAGAGLNLMTRKEWFESFMDNHFWMKSISLKGVSQETQVKAPDEPKK